MNILAKNRQPWIVGLGWLCCGWLASIAWGQSQPDALREQALEAMRRATTFYATQVAQHGGYVYHYSLDLQQRWGEGEATRDQIWVQPPGTPTVGLAYLAAYQATGEPLYLQAATAAAEALCYGQLESGGWTNCIDFDPRGERVAEYRSGRGRGRNYSSLDDAQTQSALQFLMRADAAHQHQHPVIAAAVRVGLRSLLGAQFPCGAFPQVWHQTPMPVPEAARELPPPAANYPEYDWATQGKIKEYWTLYTLNDGLAESVAATLRTADEIYGDERCRAAWLRLGDFLIAAQMPEPQPAWAQQYNFAMQPVWARKFEPPAISGLESQGVIRVLLDLYRETNEARYLQPIPAALAYLRRSQLADGRLARYYELQSNRPLYMQRTGDQYELTYDDSQLPDHYGWKVPSQLDELQTAYEALVSRKAAAAENSPDRALETSAGSGGELAEIRQLLAELDQAGRWISVSSGERLVGQRVFPKGQEYLSSAVFSDNLTRLAGFVAE